MKILSVDQFRDGGTKVIKTDNKTYYIDYAFGSNTRGHIFTDQLCNVPVTSEIELGQLANSLKASQLNNSHNVESSIHGITSYMNCLKSNSFNNKMIEGVICKGKETAIEFAEWMNLNAARRDKHEWKSKNDNWDKSYTTEEMYDIFKQLN